MTSAATRRHITPRDIEILTALDRTPLTVQQLLKLSRAFQHDPFTNTRRVQDRLAKLRQAGWLRSWPYARASHGTPPDYYKLTLEGFRVLYGPDYPVPKKRHFAEIAVAHHHHTHCLADAVVHLNLAAHESRAHVVNFYRENSLAVRHNEETLYPDGAFELRTPGGTQLNFILELDNATETVRSPKDVDSWQRKIRIYHATQDRALPRRFRVLLVTTRCSQRLHHILSLSAELSPDPRRSLFYGIDLETLLRHPDPINGRCFLDHRGQPVSLLPALRTATIATPKFRPETLACHPAVC